MAATSLRTSGNVEMSVEITQRDVMSQVSSPHVNFSGGTPQEGANTNDEGLEHATTLRENKVSPVVLIHPNGNTVLYTFGRCKVRFVLHVNTGNRWLSTQPNPKKS
jgi:hypothetical protein